MRLTRIATNLCLVLFVAVAAARPAAAANCAALAQPIACGQNIHGALNDADCDPSSSGSGHREDWYYFDTNRGPTFSAGFSAEFDGFAELYELNGRGSLDFLASSHPATGVDFQDWFPEPVLTFQFAGRKYFKVADTDENKRGAYTLILGCNPDPAVPAAVTPTTASFPVGGGDFRIWVLINGTPAAREAACLPETVCFSGAVRGRSEVFVRMTGPRQGHFVPSLVKFNTSRVQIWIEQTSSGLVNYYELAEASTLFWGNAGQHDKESGFIP